MDHIEALFFLLGLFMTGAFGVFLYLVLYQRPESPFPEEKTLALRDFEIHYQELGRGDPLLLLHGLGASLHCWHDMAPLLAEHFRVFAIDLPGFGRSSKVPEHSYGLDEQADRIEQFLDHLKIDRAYLVGNSMGGNLSLWLAKRNPRRFPGVVALAPAAHPKLVPWITGQLGFLSGPAAWMFGKSIATHFHKRTLGHPEKLRDQHIVQTLNTYRKNPQAIRALISATNAIRDSRLLTESFQSRVLVLWGEQDKLVPRWVIDELMPRIPDATLIIHKSGGHQLQQDDPEWTAKKILDFLPSRLDDA